MKTAIIVGMCFMMVFFNHGAPTSSDAGTACTVTAATRHAAASVVPPVNRLKAVEVAEVKEQAAVTPAAYAAIEPAATEPQPEDRSQLRMLKPAHTEMGEDADSYASNKQSHLLQAMMR